jgi:hypothetical protein
VGQTKLKSGEAETVTGSVSTPEEKKRVKELVSTCLHLSPARTTHVIFFV